MRAALLSLLFLCLNIFVYASDYYVAIDGDDSNSGTINSPLATIQKAQELASSGDTVFIRGGLYTMQESQIARFYSIWAYATDLDKDGINYLAYQDELPVFDYTNITPADKRIIAFYITGSNIHIKGIDIIGVQVTITQGNTQSECFRIDHGDNNTIENVNMYDNMAIGVYIVRGKDNLILNCDAYNNYDSVSQNGVGGNVDGFGVHVRNGDTGNIFRGCRAWLNSDDGFDAINSGESAIFENCWAFYNGYSSITGDFRNLVSRGDGNGFKIGGYGLGGTSYSNILSRYAPIPTNTVRFCVSAANKQSGFYANHHLEGNNWYNNSAYLNKRNYNMSNAESLSPEGISITVDGWNHVLTNNAGLDARLAELININIPECTLTTNSFDPNSNIAVTSSDFLSLDLYLLISPRQADGSLPTTDFMRPVANSDIIDAGTDIGFPFSGSAPDLGYTDYQGSLPIELLQFDVSLNDKNKPRLKWSTLSEINNDYFIVQRSLDGIYWENIKKLEGAGNSHAPLQYSFIDESILVQGTIYYRLKQVDFNESYSFSPVEAIRINLIDEDIALYPNPCQEKLTVKGIDKMEQLKFYDFLGRDCTHLVVLDSKESNKITLDLNGLLSGTYFVKINNITRLVQIVNVP